jgi:hypothetical protein
MIIIWGEEGEERKKRNSAQLKCSVFMNHVALFLAANNVPYITIVACA